MTDRVALLEKVARAMWMAYIEPYDPADRIPFEDATGTARAYVYAEAEAAIDIVLEEAARVAEAFPAHTHGNLATAPAQAAEQASDEIAAAIEALKMKQQEPTQ